MGDFDYWIVHSVPGSLHSPAFWACHITPPLQQSQRSHLCHNMVYSYTNQTCMNNGPVMWCHNIFCFFKVANKKQKITLIAVKIFLVVSLFIWIASLPSLFLARYFSVTLSDGGRHTAWFLMKNNVTLSGQFEFCYKTPFQIATTHSQDSVHYQIQFIRGILCCY